MAHNSQWNIRYNTWEDGLNWIQKLSYILSPLGVFIDQISTRIGLTHPMIYEANQNVKILLDKGLWLYVDITIIFVMILICRLIVDNWNFKNRRVVFLGPLTFGILKTITGIRNLSLYLSLMGYIF
jgi:hypothetical protein